MGIREDQILLVFGSRYGSLASCDPAFTALRSVNAGSPLPGRALDPLAGIPRFARQFPSRHVPFVQPSGNR
jgi:hypothetical protein